MQQSTVICKNCGNQFLGKFCNRCGEKVYGQKDKSILILAEEAFHFITHFNGSFFTTLKTFFTRPGKISSDYVIGIRKKYLKPVSFFLLIVITYLFFPRFPGLNMKFSSYVSEEYNFYWYAAPIARQKIKTHTLTGKELGMAYDNKSPAFAKICLLLLIPLSAFVLALLFLTSRKYFFDHFILASEIMSFYIFAHFLFLPFLSFVTDKIAPVYNYLFNDDSGLLLSIFGIFGIFIAIAFRNFYTQKVWLSIIKAVVFLFVFAAGIRYVYNAILYYLVMLFV